MEKALNKQPVETKRETPLKEIPDHMICPITRLIFMDPFVTEDGQTFEREAIETWLEKHKRNPLTNIELRSRNRIPNRNTKSAVQQFLGENPDFLSERYISTKRKIQLNDILRLGSNTGFQEAERIFQFDPRFITMPIQDDYCAIHITAQFGSAAMTEKILVMLEQAKKVQYIISCPKRFNPKYLNELVKPALVTFNRERLENLHYFGVDIEQPSSDLGNTLLHCMIKSDSVEAVKWLLN